MPNVTRGAAAVLVSLDGPGLGTPQGTVIVSAPGGGDAIIDASLDATSDAGQSRSGGHITVTCPEGGGQGGSLYVSAAVEAQLGQYGIQWDDGMSGYSGVFTVVDSGNSLPQCSTRTFPVDAGPVAPLTSSLWEIHAPSGLILDSGNRYDRFGSGRWGVVSPGLGGSGTLTITAPCPVKAPILPGYVAVSGGQSTTFNVVAGSCCGDSPPEASPMPLYVFSTGRLLAYDRIAAPALARGTVGAPSAPTLPLANLVDASPTTLADFPHADASNYSYLIADLGATTAVGYVGLGSVTCSDGTVAVYVSDSHILDGNMSGATALVPVGGALAAPLTGGHIVFVPAAAALSVSGRYVYIVPQGTGSSSVTTGNLDIRGVGSEFAQLQSVSISPKWQEAVLRGATWVSQFASDSARYDGEIQITAQMAEFASRALETLFGASRTGEDGVDTEVDLTVGDLADPPPFVIDLELRTTDQKIVRFVAWNCCAPGFQWTFGRDKFAVADWKASVYLDDTDGGGLPVARLSIQQ